MTTVKIGDIGGNADIDGICYQTSRLTCWSSFWRLITEIGFESGGEHDFEGGGNKLDW